MVCPESMAQCCCWANANGGANELKCLFIFVLAESERCAVLQSLYEWVRALYPHVLSWNKERKLWFVQSLWPYTVVELMLTRFLYWSTLLLLVRMRHTCSGVCFRSTCSGVLRPSSCVCVEVFFPYFEPTLRTVSLFDAVDVVKMHWL